LAGKCYILYERDQEVADDSHQALSKPDYEHISGGGSRYHGGLPTHFCHDTIAVTTNTS